ncbi:sugar transferase, partial [Cellulophaga baltica]|uniref:sugar transferase n=1 Tax=Cellulophaga TaxID=104264 RepID=UPI001C06921E
MYKIFFKRFFDVLLSSIILILSFPIMLVVILILFFQNKGFPFFVQDRPGKNQKVFNVYKLKTMTEERGGDGELLPDEDRITLVGNIVRKTSLDEIPQLINVLIGDMSIIGPRPLRTYYLPFYTEEENKRHLVRPGITGLAQISGRNHLNWEERFKFDVEYVNNLSLILDLKILFMSFVKVFKSSNVNIPESGIIEDFNIYRSKTKKDE